MSDQSCPEGEATLPFARAFTNTGLKQPNGTSYPVLYSNTEGASHNERGINAQSLSTDWSG